MAESKKTFDDLTENLFRKIFSLKSKKSDYKHIFRLPENEVLFSTENDSTFFDNDREIILRKFADTKLEITGIKNELSDKDLLIWHDHTDNANPAGSVVAEIRRRFDPQLCTQAWCKFYEILNIFPNLVRSRGRLRTLHLCEAPGAFIAALNYFIEAKKLWITDWDWRANSLSPYYEENSYDSMIADDRLIFHTAHRWLYGADDSGDIMQPTMVDNLGPYAARYDLVTADGSVDCQETPNEQELMVFPLHYCETVCALRALCSGGNFVLKRFTMFEPASISLLYLLCCVFEEVHFHKPSCSKSGNSEIYVVCESYLANMPSSFFTKLRSRYGPSHVSFLQEHPVIPLDEIPLWFLQNLGEGLKMFTDFQLQTIRFNLTTFRNWSPDMQMHSAECKNWVVEKFMQTNGLVQGETVCQKILFDDRVSPAWLKQQPCNRQNGKFEERCSEDPNRRTRFLLRSLGDQVALWAEKIRYGKKYRNADPGKFVIEKYEFPVAADPQWLQVEFMNSSSTFMKATFGKSVKTVVNSKFCNGNLLGTYLELREMYESLEMDTSFQDTCELESLELCQFQQAVTFATPMKVDEQKRLLIDLDINDISKVNWVDLLIILTSSEKAPKTLEITKSRAMLLTRFSADVLAFVCACYESVTLLTTENVSEPCIIKAERYHGLPAAYAENVLAFLRRMKYSLSKLRANGSPSPPSESSTDLLQFLPMPFLSVSYFYRNILRYNNTVLLKVCQGLLTSILKKKLVEK